MRRPLRVLLDAQLAIQPEQDLPRLLRAAMDNMPRLAPSDQRALALAEAPDGVFFQALAQDEIRLPGESWRIMAWDPAGGVQIRHLPDTRDIWIFAGRRARTAEGWVVSSLFCDTPITEGKTLSDTLREIHEAGGTPLLPWPSSLGRTTSRTSWTAFLKNLPAQRVLLADTSLRPVGWPLPAHVRWARRQGWPMLAGTGPIPIHEDTVGRYHAAVTVESPCDPSRLSAALQDALASDSPHIGLLGQRRSFAAVRRWAKLAR